MQKQTSSVLACGNSGPYAALLGAAPPAVLVGSKVQHSSCHHAGPIGAGEARVAMSKYDNA